MCSKISHVRSAHMCMCMTILQKSVQNNIGPQIQIVVQTCVLTSKTVGRARDRGGLERCCVSAAELRSPGRGVGALPRGGGVRRVRRVWSGEEEEEKVNRMAQNKLLQNSSLHSVHCIFFISHSLKIRVSSIHARAIHTIHHPPSAQLERTTD